MKAFGCLFALLLFCCIATGDGFEKGYVSDEGYSYGGDGYWYYNSVPYTRQKEYYYYQNYGYGPYYQTYRWRYKQYYPPTSYQAATAYALPAPSDPGWRAKLIELAKYRDDVVGKMKLSALEHAEYMEAVKAFGFENNFYWEGYGQSVRYPGAYYGQANYNVGSYGANGNTIYGHSYASMAELYGQTDMNILYQQSAKLTQNAQELAAQANSEFAGLVDKAGGYSARTAEILAKGKAAALALQAAEGQSVKVYSSSGTYGTRNGVGSGVGTVSPPQHEHEYRHQAQPKVDLDVLRNQVMEKHCFACHNQKERDGKLDLTVGYGSLDELLKDEIFRRIFSNNAEKRMPQGIDGRPPTVLSEEEKRLFVRQLPEPPTKQ